MAKYASNLIYLISVDIFLMYNNLITTINYSLFLVENSIVYLIRSMINEINCDIIDHTGCLLELNKNSLFFFINATISNINSNSYVDIL